MDNPSVYRRCHWLNTNARSGRPHAMVFLDTEATILYPYDHTEEHTFKLASASYCRYSKKHGFWEDDWLNFTRPESLWRWVLDKSRGNKRLLVVAHNLDYDARVSRAIPILTTLGATPRYAIMSTGCTFFTFAYEGHEIALLDNLGIWPASLEEIGHSVGIEKMHVDFDSVSISDLFAYCRNDVKILVEQWKQWLEFLDANDMGAFAITIAGQAFHAYRHRFIPVQIGIHDNKAALEMERAAYKGGRVEMFQVGKLPKGRYYKLDVNSLYPYMMKEHFYPSRLIKVVENVCLTTLRQLAFDWHVIAEVLVETPEPCFVVKRDGKNCYPTGSFFTTLTTPEFRYALEHGYIKGIGRVAVYERDDLFGDFVTTFYNLRQDYAARGDTARAKMCKLIMNSLQGKLGQIGYAQTQIGTAPPDAVGVTRWLLDEPGLSCNDVTFGGKTFRQMTAGESNNSFPAIPAHVCAYGRMYMWDLINVAGRRNVFYCDTDSLIVNHQGYLHLQGCLHPTKLGALKVEGETTCVHIYAKKDYAFGEGRVRKGVKENAVEVSPGVFSQWHFTSLKWGMNEQQMDSVTVHKVKRAMRYSEVVGTVGHGGRIIPPNISVSVDDILSRIPNRAASSWTWEFDPDWLHALLSPVEQPGSPPATAPLF